MTKMSKSVVFIVLLQMNCGNILTTENQQDRLNDVIEVIIGVYLYKA